VTWGDSEDNDPKRWRLCITDTGPGFHSGSDQPLTQALEKAQHRADEVRHVDTHAQEQADTANEADVPVQPGPAGPVRDATGEGLGLSIVKRLCDLLDATIEMTSETGVGTSFRILLPRHYSG
jgi:signal transduction histidine kinase